MPFESDAFTPGTATAYLTAETGAIVVDGAAEAIGLLVTVTVDGEPAGSGAGVVEGAIDGFVVLAVSYCVPPGFLPDTGSDLTVIALWSGVLLLIGGALLQLWVRRTSIA